MKFKYLRKKIKSIIESQLPNIYENDKERILEIILHIYEHLEALKMNEAQQELIKNADLLVNYFDHK